MNKKGQIYLLTAIILAFIIFGLVSTVNKAEQENLKSDFEKLSENYEAESAKLVNYLLLEDKSVNNVEAAFQNFTVKFTSYAKAKNPKFGLVYAFNFNDRLYIGNYLDKEIASIECFDSEGRKVCNVPEGLSACYAQIPSTIELGGLALDVDFDQSLIKDCHKDIQLQGPIQFLKLTILAEKPYDYEFKLKPNQPQIMLMSQEEKGAQRKIYVPEEARRKKTLTRSLPLSDQNGEEDNYIAGPGSIGSVQSEDNLNSLGNPAGIGNAQGVAQI